MGIFAKMDTIITWIIVWELKRLGSK